MIIAAMAASTRVHLFVGAIALALGVAACADAPDVGCDTPPDLPSDWACARTLEVVSTASTCDQGIPDEVPTLALVSADGGWQLIAAGLVFRPEQTICAYARDDDDALDVLLQPCDMHPAAPLKGSCGYELVVGIDADVAHVRGYRRWDLVGDPPMDDLLALGELDVP